MDTIDPADPRASYQVVADTIRARIEDGSYPVGTKLPPHHEMAAEFDVSVGTLKHAYALLQKANLIAARQGMGTFVRQQVPAPELEVPAESGTLADAFARISDLTSRLEHVERQLRQHG